MNNIEKESSVDKGITRNNFLEILDQAWDGMKSTAKIIDNKTVDQLKPLGYD